MQLATSPATPLTLSYLNQAPVAEFVRQLGDLYEHSPWIAEAAASQRPFSSQQQLLETMQQILAQADQASLLALIRAHPELAGRAAIAGDLTQDSSREQAAAGLTQCTPAQYAELTQLNQAYQQRFGWPFIVAVSGLSVDDILQAMRTRLSADPAAEYAEALYQINRIAALRLQQRLAA